MQCHDKHWDYERHSAKHGHGDAGSEGLLALSFPAALLVELAECEVCGTPIRVDVFGQVACSGGLGFEPSPEPAGAPSPDDDEVVAKPIDEAGWWRLGEPDFLVHSYHFRASWDPR